MAKGSVSDRDVTAGLQSSRPFECSWEDCPKSFNRKSDLQRHFRIHTNERPYYCTYGGCSKTFIQRSALTVHNRTHTGEKPHRCKHEGCGKKFSDVHRNPAESFGSLTDLFAVIKSGETSPNTQRFCRKTTLTKHAKKHPVEGSSMIDDVAEDSAEDDWDSEPEGSPQDPNMAASQTGSRPSSCFGNHWPLPAETVQRSQYGHHPGGKLARRLESSLDSIKLERSSSSSPTLNRLITDPVPSYQYVPTSEGISRKPAPLRTSLPQEYRSVPMDHQYSNDTSIETFQSPQAMTSPSSYAHFSPVPSDTRQQPLYVQPPRYNSFPQSRVHDINLDDAMSTSQHSNVGTPSNGQFPNGAEPISAQASQYGMGTPTIQEQFQQAYANPVHCHQQYQDARAGLIEDLRFQMPTTDYPTYGTPAPEWYTNIKPEETWEGHALPRERLSDF